MKYSVTFKPKRYELFWLLFLSYTHYKYHIECNENTTLIKC